MPTQKKKEIVEDLVKNMEKSEAVILTGYSGINVEDITALRKQLFSAGVRLKVVKNTLVRIAAKQAGKDDLLPLIEGATGYVFTDNIVEVSKALRDFAKEHPQIKFKGGMLQGKLLKAEAIKALANLPPRDILLGMIANALNAPITGLARALAGVPRGLATVLDAVRKQKEEQQAAAPAA